LKTDYRFCPRCAAELAAITQAEDGGDKVRLRCPACGWTHWNNPTPVLAAVIECSDREGQLLLARNAAWPGRMFGLITGFMEAGETPEQGIAREVAEETALEVESLALIGEAPISITADYFFQVVSALVMIALVESIRNPTSPSRSASPLTRKDFDGALPTPCNSNALPIVRSMITASSDSGLKAMAAILLEP